MGLKMANDMHIFTAGCPGFTNLSCLLFDSLCFLFGVLSSGDRVEQKSNGCVSELECFTLWLTSQLHLAEIKSS
jgi:hypothetical protein